MLKDSQSNPNRAGEVANDLILKDKVALMLTAGTPETANPVSDACELNEVPCISHAWCRGSRGSSAARATRPRASTGRITSSGAWKT